MIEPVATSLEERNLYGDKLIYLHICDFHHWKYMYVISTYLKCIDYVLFLFLFLFFYFYKEFQESFFNRNSFHECEDRKYVNKCSIQENKKM